MHSEIGTIKCIIINTTHKTRSVQFWTEVLGRSITAEYPPYTELKKEGEMTIVIQQIDEKVVREGGVHFDLKVTDLDVAIQKVCKLGGEHVKTLVKAKWAWAIMKDPDGNIFCLCD